MPGSYGWILLVFITFLFDGLTYGQVDDLSCGPFCLSSQTVCTCTITGTILIWEVDGGDNIQDAINLRNPDLNVPMNLSMELPFQALLTNTAGGTFTATLTFTTMTEYQGYKIQCDTDGNPETRNISIPGLPLSVTNLELSDFTADSVMLSFAAPADSMCIANYAITTDADAVSSTTDTNVMISRPTNDAEGVTYFVSVAAVDFAGRMGDKESLECFTFSSPNAVSFADDVGYMYTMQGDNCTAQIEWTSMDCLPDTSYNVTISSNQEVTREVVLEHPTRSISVDLGQDFTITVIPSNTFGFGSPTSSTFAVPTNCPPQMMDDDTTTTSTSGSIAVLSPGSGRLPFGAMVGTLIAFAVSWIGV